MLASYICQRKVRHPLTGYNKNRQFMTQDGEGIQQLTNSPNEKQHISGIQQQQETVVNWSLYPQVFSSSSSSSSSSR